MAPMDEEATREINILHELPCVEFAGFDVILVGHMACQEAGGVAHLAHECMICVGGDIIQAGRVKQVQYVGCLVCRVSSLYPNASLRSWRTRPSLRRHPASHGQQAR
jgi:hypothetical protein